MYHVFVVQRWKEQLSKEISTVNSQKIVRIREESVKIGTVVELQPLYRKPPGHKRLDLIFALFLLLKLVEILVFPM